MICRFTSNNFNYNFNYNLLFNNNYNYSLLVALFFANGGNLFVLPIFYPRKRKVAFHLVSELLRNILTTCTREREFEGTEYPTNYAKPSRRGIL